MINKSRKSQVITDVEQTFFSIINQCKHIGIELWSKAAILCLWQVGILNIDGYYNCLLGLFDKGVEEGFIEHTARNIVISAETAGELIDKMEVLIFLWCLLVFALTVSNFIDSEKQVAISNPDVLSYKAACYAKKPI